MTENINTAKRAALVLAGAGLALATVGCMTTDRYGSDPYENDPYASGPYADGNNGQTPYDPQGGYDPAPNQYPGADNYPAPYQGAPAVAPRRISGDIATRDFPRGGAQQRDGRRAVYRIDVGTDGRVQGCRASEPSGIAELDAFMCRLIGERFVYEPARDANGRPVPGVAGWQQSWNLPGR